MTRLVLVLDALTGKDRQSVLIADDSLFSRNRSKKVELMAKVFDHTSHKFFRGFRMLTLGWSDGTSFLPLLFQLLSSAEDKNVYCPALRKDQRTLAYKRRVNARRSTLDILLDMIRAVQHIPAKYILLDSWFTMEHAIRHVITTKLDDNPKYYTNLLEKLKQILAETEGEWEAMKKHYTK